MYFESRLLERVLESNMAQMGLWPRSLEKWAYGSVRWSKTWLKLAEKYCSG